MIQCKLSFKNLHSFFVQEKSDDASSADENADTDRDVDEGKG